MKKLFSYLKGCHSNILSSDQMVYRHFGKPRFIVILFSSAEPKAEVSFSDRNLSVIQMKNYALFLGHF